MLFSLQFTAHISRELEVLKFRNQHDGGVFSYLKETQLLKVGNLGIRVERNEKLKLQPSTQSSR